MPDTPVVPPAPHKYSLHVSPYRIESLTDGVFSITMTIMVFNIKVPPGDTSRQLLDHLLAYWPDFFTLIISFLLLGIYWTGFRFQYHFIRRVDHESQWLAMGFLAAVSLLPFSTDMLASYATSHLALIIFGLNLTLIGLLMYFHWAYATHHRRLVDADLAHGVVVFGAFRALAAPAGYCIAMAFIWIAPSVTLALYVVVPVLYLMPWTHRHLLKYFLMRSGVSDPQDASVQQ